MTGVTTTRGGGGGGGAFLPHPSVAAMAAAAQRMLRPRTSSRFIPRLLDLESERWGLLGKPRPSARPLDHSDLQTKGLWRPPRAAEGAADPAHASANREGGRSIPAARSGS